MKIFSVLRQIYEAFRDYVWPFAKAFVKLGWNGFAFATKEQARSRQEICKQCDLYDPDMVACRCCGCGLSADVGGWRRMFEKVYYKDEQCPMNKWGKINP